MDGRLRNTSDRSLKFVKVTVSFEDRAGKLVRSESSYCEPQTIGPGESASFSLMAPSDPRYSSYKISIRDSKRAIPWTDRSGKNVHD